MDGSRPRSPEGIKPGSQAASKEASKKARADRVALHVLDDEEKCGDAARPREARREGEVEVRAGGKIEVVRVVELAQARGSAPGATRVAIAARLGGGGGAVGRCERRQVSHAVLVMPPCQTIWQRCNRVCGTGEGLTRWAGHSLSRARGADAGMGGVLRQRVGEGANELHGRWIVEAEDEAGNFVAYLHRAAGKSGPGPYIS